jgi:hypothetical protein
MFIFKHTAKCSDESWVGGLSLAVRLYMIMECGVYGRQAALKTVPLLIAVRVRFPHAPPNMYMSPKIEGTDEVQRKTIAMISIYAKLSRA